jgi:hypothetical protein
MQILVSLFLLIGTMTATAASVSGSSKGVSFATSVPPESIRVTGPQGFAASVQGSSLQSATGLPDGLYRYEITAATGTGAPRVFSYDSGLDNGRDSYAAQRGSSRYTAVVDFGVFRIVGGQVVSADAVEEQR